jgi:hypothetical protein
VLEEPEHQPHTRVQHRGVDPLVVEDPQAEFGVATALTANASGGDVVLQTARERVLRPPQAAFDAVGDVPVGFGDELHGAVAHSRRNGIDQFGKRLLDVPVGVDHQRHRTPYGGGTPQSI